MRIRFKESVSGNFLGKKRKYVSDGEYHLPQDLIDSIANTLGRKDFYIQASEKSILDKKDVSSIKSKVTKNKVTEKAIRK